MKRYDNYKDSGIEWIGEIPEHWEIQRLKYAFDLGTGLSITKENLIEKGVPCVNYGEIHSKYGFEVDINKHNLKCVDLNYLNTSKKALMKQGEFIFADTSEDIEGSGNFTHIKSNGDIFAGYHTITARPIKKSNSLYFAFLFDSIDYRTQIRNSVKGIKVFSITQGILKDTFIWHPPIEEQTAISNYLDRKTAQIDTLIAKKEQFISLLHEERIAVINQAATKGLDPKVKMKDSGIEWLGEIPEHWKVTRLGFLSSKIGDGLHGTPNYVDNSDFKFINGNNIGDGQISIYEHTKCVSEEEYLSNKKELNENSILMSINGTIGNLGFYKGEKVMLGKSVAYINIIDYKTLNFTYKYLESESCKTYIDNQLSGSTIKNLSLYSINKIPIPFPSFDEQKEIVDYITIKTNEINVLITKTQQEIELLKEYKTALISEVVTGKVDVRKEKLN